MGEHFDPPKTALILGYPILSLCNPFLSMGRTFSDCCWIHCYPLSSMTYLYVETRKPIVLTRNPNVWILKQDISGYVRILKGYLMDMQQDIVWIWKDIAWICGITWLRIAGAGLKVRFTVIAATLIWISVRSFVSGSPRLKVPCRFSSSEARDWGHPLLVSMAIRRFCLPSKKAVLTFEATDCAGSRFRFQLLLDVLSHFQYW